MFSCNLRCRLIFSHGCSQTCRVSSLRAGPEVVFRITCTLIVNLCGISHVISINEYRPTFLLGERGSRVTRVRSHKWCVRVWNSPEDL